MPRMKRALILATVLTLLLAACSSPQEGTPPPPEPVTFGLVLALGADPNTPALLENALEAELARPFEVVVFPSAVELDQALAAGDLDFAHLGPHQTAAALANSEASLVAIAVRGGGPTYRGQFNVRCDLGATELTDLAGARFGFVAIGSASGYYVPYVTLLDAGIDPEVDLTTSFAGSHDAVILGIYENELDAGVSFEGGRGTIEADHPDVNEVVCVLGYTDPIPNDAIVARTGLDASLAQATGAALINLSDDAAGQAALGAFGTTALAAGSADLYHVLERVLEEFFN